MDAIYMKKDIWEVEIPNVINMISDKDHHHGIIVIDTPESEGRTLCYQHPYYC